MSAASCLHSRPAGVPESRIRREIRIEKDDFRLIHSIESKSLCQMQLNLPASVHVVSLDAPVEKRRDSHGHCE